jgi:predicted small integral membrane protein
MKNIAVIMLIVAALGLTIVAFGFVTDFQPMWMHSARLLPDKETFTRHEVVSVLVQHAEYVRTRYLLGVMFSALGVVGAVVVLKPQRKTA